MLEGRVFRGIDLNAQSFQNRFKGLPPEVQVEARDRFKAMLMSPLDQAPRAWHMHMLNDKKVESRVDPKKKVNAWTMHLNTADTYKASFTFEDGVAYFRTCGLHDKVDKTP
jgi:hypothetical protein